VRKAERIFASLTAAALFIFAQLFPPPVLPSLFLADNFEEIFTRFVGLFLKGDTFQNGFETCDRVIIAAVLAKGIAFNYTYRHNSTVLGRLM
jgi:ABC-type nitrate/sulfonate/bicarbonate transport system permease component